MSLALDYINAYLYLHVRILLAELFLEHFADLAAGFALLFHALDGLVGGKEGGGADFGAEIADALVPGQQLKHIVQGGAVQPVDVNVLI